MKVPFDRRISLSAPTNECRNGPPAAATSPYPIGGGLLNEHRAAEFLGLNPRPRYSRAALQRACEAIERAPVGQQEPTLSCECYGIGRLIGAGLMPRKLAIDCLIHSGTMMTNAPGRRPWREREIQQKVVRAVCKGGLYPREVA